MTRFAAYNRRHRHGFTLVELVIALVLLAILASALTVSLIGYVRKAREARLLTACRACVVAAQTLISEEYGTTGTVVRPPDDAAIRALAGIEEGHVMGVIFDHVNYPPSGRVIDQKDTYTIIRLTYANERINALATYYAELDSPFRVDYGRKWVKGDTYEKGEIMYFPDDPSDEDSVVYMFRCLASHKSGSRSNTRNPTVKSNKGSWEMIGTQDGRIPPYDSVVRFAVGGYCTYKGNLYARTDYNLTGGQTPYSKSSSRYWLLIGPAPEDSAADGS